MAKIQTIYSGGELSAAPCSPQTISLVNPSSLEVNSGITTVTVNGSNFTPSATVTLFNPDNSTSLTVANYTFLSSAQVAFSVDAGVNVGFYDLTITNACGSVVEVDAIEIVPGDAIVPGSASTPWDNCN